MGTAPRITEGASMQTPHLATPTQKCMLIAVCDYKAARDRLLGRKLWEEDIIDTVGEEEPPAYVVRKGPERVADWQRAADIWRELERAVGGSKP
jgi:hypothetical protein